MAPDRTPAIQQSREGNGVVRRGGFGRLRAAGGEAECFRGKRGQNIIRPDRDQRRWRAGKKRSRTWFIRTMLIRTMLGRTRLGRTGADSAGRAAMEPSEDSRPDDHPAKIGRAHV